MGDVWYITAGIQEIKPYKLLVTLNDSVPADADPFGEAHSFVHGIGDYYTAWQNFEIDFSQFWRLGNIIDCRDRKPGRWGSWSNHNVSAGTPYELLYYDVFDPEEINGEIFYTKQRFTWNLSSHPSGARVLCGNPCGRHLDRPDQPQLPDQTILWIFRNDPDQSAGRQRHLFSG